MEKIAFKMKLKPGMSAEYKRRHDAIWPELITLLRENGVSDYSIFLDEETDTLFAVQYLAGHSSQELGKEVIVQQWWDYMHDIMDVNPDRSPVSINLKKVFHMD